VREGEDCRLKGRELQLYRMNKSKDRRTIAKEIRWYT
jgi:hypothetical protein